eukprot:gene5152-34966_t
MPALALAAYLEELRCIAPEAPLQPDLKGQGRQEHDKKLREDQELASGAVLQAVLEAGKGGSSPVEGDLVYVHFSVIEGDDDILYSTRAEDGGTGHPLAFIMEKGRRAPRGWEIALGGMSKGQRNMLKLKPTYGYKHPDCTMQPPRGVSASLASTATLSFDLQLVSWHPAAEVKAIGEDGDKYRRMLSEGAGWETPRAPFEVTLLCSAYTPAHTGGMLSGFEYFDTPKDSPLCVQLGQGALPLGVEEALGYMNKGETSAFVLPAASMLQPTADKQGASKCLIPDPPGKNVQQVEVRDLTGNGEVFKRRLKEGDGDFPVDCPIVDTTVRINYRVRLLSAQTADTTSSWVFDSRIGAGSSAASSAPLPPVEFDTGCGDMPEGLEMAVKLMVPGELALVRCHSPRYGYKDVLELPPGVLAEDDVEWEVELVSFDKEGHWQNISMDERLVIAKKAKAKGNQLFKAGRHKYARAKYEALLRQLESTRDYETQDQVDSIDALKLAVASNMAMCCIALEDYAKAVVLCDKAMQQDPDSVKLMFRRAKALSLKGDYEEAASNFEEALEKAMLQNLGGGGEGAGGGGGGAVVDTDAILREMELNKKRAKAAEQKQKQTFRSFFDR